MTSAFDTVKVRMQTATVALPMSNNKTAVPRPNRLAGIFKQSTIWQTILKGSLYKGM